MADFAPTHRGDAPLRLSMRPVATAAWPGAHLRTPARTGPQLPVMQRSEPVLRMSSPAAGVGRLHPATEARLDRIDRLARQQYRLLISGVSGSLIGMALFVWLYGWGEVADSVAGDMLRLFFGASALVCASALTCFTVLLADWHADNSLPDARPTFES